jgi:hypothetical protein
MAAALKDSIEKGISRSARDPLLLSCFEAEFRISSTSRSVDVREWQASRRRITSNPIISNACSDSGSSSSKCTAFVVTATVQLKALWP